MNKAEENAVFQMAAFAGCVNGIMAFAHFGKHQYTIIEQIKIHHLHYAMVVAVQKMDYTPYVDRDFGDGKLGMIKAKIVCERVIWSRTSG